MRKPKSGWRRGFVFIVIILMAIYDVYFYINIWEQQTKTTFNPEKYNFKVITSIQYSEIKETYGAVDGRNLTNTTITYVYPDKLRIEKNGKTKTVEIYNNNRYIYYDDINNKIKLKECFPPDNPYISEIEKRMAEIFENGDYEFFGYEEVENRRTEVIGIKSKLDDYSYMHKLWIAEINGILLPIREQYYINNSVVSKSTYNYLRVNEPVNPELFTLGSLPKTEAVEDGVIPKYVKSLVEAEKYLKFKLLVPDKLPEGFIETEITVIPPVKNPSFRCVFLKEGNKINFVQGKENMVLKSNGTFGSIPCEYAEKDGKISLVWNQNGFHLVLSGDIDTEGEIRIIGEQIAGGKLVLNN
jgi:hypothetical protein